MKSNLLTASCLIGLTIAQVTTPAPEVTNNKPGVAYKATLFGGPQTSIEGSLVAKSSSDGKGVVISVDFSGFPGFDTTNYTYHIHTHKIPDDGNCTAALGHLDPYHAGATSASPSTYKCDPTKPELCELGDLSGKHGAISHTDSNNAYLTQYTDLYLSTTPGDTAFFGDLSIVVHQKIDNKRLRCGNFEPVPSNEWEGWSTTTTTTTTNEWAIWSTTTTPTTTKEWAGWSTTTTTTTGWETWSTKSVSPVTTSTWSEWASTTKAPVSAATSAWSAWSQTTAPSTTVTNPSVYTGAASLISSRDVLGISGLITMIMAAVV